MSLIALDTSKCVRSLSRESACNKCEVLCPTAAIVVGTNPLPSINFSACVGCGACEAICPNEALSLDDFSATNFFFDFLEEEGNLISCRKNVPCIAALSVEHLISLAVLKKELLLDVGHCERCDIAHTCQPQIFKNVEEASYLLEAMQTEVSIRVEKLSFEANEEAKTSDRRTFLRSINLETIAQGRANFEQEVKKATDELIEHSLDKRDIELLKTKRIPQRRKLFFTAMKRVQKPAVFHTVDASEVSFTSQKSMNEALCTACQMCYRVCPTGALTSDVKNSKIDFDPFLCIKCGVCHEVCEPDALLLSEAYNTKEFFEPQVQNLISFAVRRCDECNLLFSTNKGEKLCYRCKTEEEEARELWGITDE